LATVEKRVSGRGVGEVLWLGIQGKRNGESARQIRMSILGKKKKHLKKKKLKKGKRATIPWGPERKSKERKRKTNPC